MRISDPEWTVERVRELFDYDPTTGVLTWRSRPVRPEFVSQDKVWNGRFAGTPAGVLTNYGYILVTVTADLRTELNVLAHRIVWLWWYGQWPSTHIDHRNRIRNDNRIDNLRLATVSQNLANSKIRRDNISGVKGVSYQKARGMWRARLNVGGRQVYYGYFASKDEAVAARQRAAQVFLGDFANEG